MTGKELHRLFVNIVKQERNDQLQWDNMLYDRQERWNKLAQRIAAVKHSEGWGE